jgi:hypothetical protein
MTFLKRPSPQPSPGKLGEGADPPLPWTGEGPIHLSRGLERWQIHLSRSRERSAVGRVRVGIFGTFTRALPDLSN